jgi:membrane protein implicated in regulation of membrane protease activity
MSALGIALVVAGATLMVAEAHLASHGLLGTIAAAALATGLALVVAGAGAAAGAVIGVAVAGALAGLVLAAVVMRASLKARRTRVRAGPSALLGKVGTVRAVPSPVGQVQLDGTLWRARLWEIDRDRTGALAEGDPVVVDRVDGLTLTVRPAEEWEVWP